jgi:hypothetical protein
MLNVEKQIVYTYEMLWSSMYSMLTTECNISVFSYIFKLYVCYKDSYQLICVVAPTHVSVGLL